MLKKISAILLALAVVLSTPLVALANTGDKNNSSSESLFGQHALSHTHEERNVLSLTSEQSNAFAKISLGEEVLAEKISGFDVGDIEFYEREPNDTTSTADLIGSDYTVRGALSDTDLDFFKFVVSSASDFEYISISDSNQVIAALCDYAGDVITFASQVYSGGYYYNTLEGVIQPGTYYMVMLNEYRYYNTSYLFYINYTPQAPAHTHSYSSSCDATCNTCGETRNVTHSYTNDCDAECNVCGAGRMAPHKYSNDCDTSCNLCGATRNVSHNYSDRCDTSCNTCGASRTAPHEYYDESDTTCDNCGHIREIKRYTIAVNETKRMKWTGPDATFVEFTPTISGFYNFKILDYNRTSKVFVEISDLTTGESVGFFC